MQECGPCPAPAMAAFINILEFMVIVAVWVLVNFVMCSSRLYFLHSPAHRCHAQERMCRAITCSQVSEPGIYGNLSGCSTDCQHHVCIAFRRRDDFRDTAPEVPRSTPTLHCIAALCSGSYAVDWPYSLQVVFKSIFGILDFDVRFCVAAILIYI